ncbi:MAG TPA: phosphotransferase [Thermoanaerobaculia bacterium]|nr:phosphotransferase [Thermoanaerobaculia bacterium]
MLLADFHIHTTWSDGKLSLPEVVDLFGRSGHDVIAITDHIVNRDHPVGRVAHRLDLSLTSENFDSYLEEIETESRRAWDQYGMVVLAGAELTRNAILRRNSAHALAIGIDRFIPAEGSIEDMLTRARDAKAIVVACHPNEMSDWYANTFYLWNRRREVEGLIDLWEIACRWDLFPRVGRERLSYIGNSDFHDRPHLHAWKTLLPCEKTPRAVLQALRRGEGLALTRLGNARQLEAGEPWQAAVAS